MGSRTSVPTRSSSDRDRLASVPQYDEFAPGSALADFVACFWSFCIPVCAPGFEHSVVPDGCVSIAWIRKLHPPASFAKLVGPRTEALQIHADPGDLFCGARLLPGASGSLLGIPGAQLRDQLRPLDSFPDLAASMLPAIERAETPHAVFTAMKRELAGFASRAPSMDEAVCRATIRLLRTRGSARVTDLISEVGISERQFRRRFRHSVGLCPKEFSKIVRARCACIEIAASSRGSLAAIAQEAGYSDQSHMSREFAVIFGAQAGRLSTRIRAFSHGGFQTGQNGRFVQDGHPGNLLSGKV